MKRHPTSKRHSATVAGRPRQAPWGWQGEREENGVGLWGLFRAKSWGYSAFQYILPNHWQPETPNLKTNRCARRFAATPRPFGPRQPHGAAKLRNYPGSLVATLEVHPQMMMPTPSRHVHAGLGTSAHLHAIPPLKPRHWQAKASL
jgi:hypothetical protein